MNPNPRNIIRLSSGSEFLERKLNTTTLRNKIATGEAQRKRGIKKPGDLFELGLDVMT